MPKLYGLELRNRDCFEFNLSLAKQMQKTLCAFGIVVLLLLCSGCTYNDHSVRVTDVRKDEVITLKNTHNQQHVYGIEIRGTGKVDGDATITLMLKGKPYKVEKLKGPVGFKWGGDWYSDTAEIRYAPNNVNSGEIVVEYKFLTLKQD